MKDSSQAEAPARRQAPAERKPLKPAPLRAAPEAAGGSAGRPIAKRDGASPRRLDRRAAAASASAAGTRLAAVLSRTCGQLRPREWRRRYFTLLSHLHRHVADRGIERLLFVKTPRLKAHTVISPENGRKSFLYQGPIPGKALEWALAVLPEDLKRYAFVDFCAGNGRALLLAARRNFEHVSGYASSPETLDALEMNLAQYPRSYMRCRDIRALSGGRDGLAIPSQPAVLFFPDSLSESHLGNILEQVAESQRRAPRRLYLIFENSGRERGFGQMQLFERVRLPFPAGVKALLFSPARIAVYKSRDEGGAD